MPGVNLNGGLEEAYYSLDRYRQGICVSDIFILSEYFKLVTFTIYAGIITGIMNHQ